MDTETFLQQLALVLSDGPATITVGQRKTLITGTQTSVDLPNNMLPQLTSLVFAYRKQRRQRRI
jgi:hypothetical protein